MPIPSPAQPVILAIGAHPDDVELGCGATLARYRATAHIVTLTPCGVETEWERSMRTLDPVSSTIYHLKRRSLDRQDIRERVRELLEIHRDQITPSIVFTHHPSQYHQDHQVVYEETRRVFKWHTIVSYSLAGGYIPNVFVPVRPADLQVKQACLACYTSQHHHKDGGQPRYMQQPDTVAAVARLRGAQIRQPLAEAFELRRGVFTW